MGKIKVSNGTETFEIDGNDLQSAIKDGYKPTERIIVANSKTNESYEIDPQDVESALNDGFTYSDIVKKNGASQPLSTEPVKPSKDILTLSRERKELQNKISGARSTTRTATAAPGGYVSTTDSGAEEYKKQLADANESIKAQGGDEQLAEDIWDIPQGEGFSFVKDIPGLMKLRNENKYAYGRELAAIKSKGNLYNAVRDKSDVQTANNVIQGLQQLEKKDYRSATKDGIGLIREYVDDTDEQKKLIKDYVANKAYDYGAQPIDEEWLSQYPNLNPYQARAMRFMQDVDPATFQAYQRLMSTSPDDQWMGSREGDIRRGYETKGKELEDIGMNLQMKAYEETLTGLKNKVDAGQQLTPEEQNKYNSILGEYQTLAADKQNQNQRYPSVAVMDADRLMQEALGSKNSIVKKFALGVGENFDDAVNWVGDLIQDKGVNGDLELLGDKEMSGLNRYTAEKDKLIGSEFVAKFSPDLQKQIDEIKGSELSDEQKQDKVRELILNNQDQVQSVANDKSGKYNFTSKAVFNVVGDVASDLVSQLAIGAMTGGGGNASKIKNLTSLFGSTFATAYNDYYNDALKQNIANPTQYAILHTSIEAASELINDDFEVAKKLVGKGTTLGKVLNKATREEWDAIAKKGFFDKFKDAAIQTGKSALGNSLQETKEEVAGQVAGNIVDQQIFNKESGIGEGVKDTMIQTMVGMLPLGLLSLPFNYHNVNRTQKYAMYEAGMNPDKFIQAIDNDVASGAITQQEAKERKLNVEAAARAVKSSPALRTDGAPMTDNEKAEYVFNQSVLQEIKEQKKDAPPDIKESLEKEEEKLQQEQSELLKPKKQKQTPEIKIINKAIKDGKIPDTIAAQAKENPNDFFKMVADQIYGLNADGSQSLLPDAEKATREQYGSKVVDKAKELYPLTQKTETYASAIRSDQGQVSEGGQIGERSEDQGRQDIQPPAIAQPIDAETQQQTQGEEIEKLPEDVYIQMYNDYRQNLEEDEAPLSLNEFIHRIDTETLTDRPPSEKAVNREVIDKSGKKYKAIADSHGNDVYSIKLYDGDKRIGTLRLTKLKGTNNHYATGVDVNNKYQRKGLASKMYNLAEKEYGINIVPSSVQSKDGKAFWKNRNSRKSEKEAEINTPEDLERELGKIFAEEQVPVKEQVEGVVVTPNKEKKPKPTKEKKEKPVLKPKEQEQADYAYTNSYPYFKKKYPDVDVDEYNRLRSLKRQQGLPKLGEINQDNNVRPKGEDITQYTPQSIIQKAREFYKGDPLINRVLLFLEPIIKANTNIKIDTSFKWDSPQYEGQKITNQALGYSFPSGNLILNFDRMSDYDTLYRTALHEMVHAATRTEIETNKAFNEDLKKVLTEVRRAMKLPEGDSVVDALIRNKVISEDYDSRYGAANEHELLAEVFTNQKFSEFLKGLEYKGDNMLHRLFLAIAKFFSQKYKALVSAKESISVDNIADYLMGLTESVVAGQQEQSKGGALPLIRPGIKEVLKKTITKALEKNLSDQIIRDKLKQIGGLTDQEVDELMAEVVPLSPSVAPARELTEGEVGATPTEPKRKSKFRRFKEKYFDRAKGMPDWILKYKDRAKGTAHLEVRQALQLVEKTRKTAKNIGFDDWELFDRALRDQYYGSQLLELQALPMEMQVLAVQMRNKIDGLSRDLIINNYVTPEQALNIESNIGEYMTRSYRAFNEKDWGKKVPQKAKDDAFRLLTQQRFNELLIEREDDVNAGSVTEYELIEDAKMEAFNELQSIIDGISDKYTPPKINVQKGKDLGILKQRQDIPKEIREVLGEYTDPGVNFAMTIARIASLKSSAEYLTSIRREGVGEIFFEADSRPPEASVQIKSEGSETWNPLNGLYTTPEVKEIFDETEVIRNKWVQLWLKGVGAIKWGKTVGSLVTQVKNFESNLGFAVMNGHYRAGKSSESFKFLKDKLFKGERSQDEMIEKVIRLGIVDQSIGVRELKDMFATDNLDKVIVNSSLGEKSPLKKIGNNLIGKPIKYLNKVYGASDDFWKVYGFLNEAESLSRATYNKSYKELIDDEQSAVDIEASERVKNVYPTYDRVWEGAKSLSKGLPIFGNFLSFQAESVRVLLNTFNYAIKDLKTPGRTLMGAQRLAGIGAYIGARSMILYTIAQMTGVGMAGLLGLASDDDEDQKLKDVNRYSPEFIRSGDKLTLDHGGGKYTVYDVGSLEPYGVWFKTMNAYNEGNDIVKDGGIAASATELLSPFFEPEMSFKMLVNIYNNENDFGSRIYNPMDGGGDKTLDVMEFIIKKAKPSTIDLIQRIYSKEDKTNEVSAIFGGRGYDVDIAKSFSFKLKAAEELFDANRDALNKIKYNGESTEDQIAEAEIKFEERTNKVIKMLSEDYQAAIRLGTSIEALDEILSRKKFFQGYNKNVKNQIKSGAVEQESASEEIKEWQP